MTTEPSSPLAWHHTLKSVGPRGVSTDREATAAEREHLRSELGALSVHSFHAHYTLTAESSGCFLLAGDFTAKLTQACVVTLEPVEQNIAETFSVKFAPPDKMPEPDTKERSVLDEPDVEILTGDSIDAGRVIFELLNAAIDPYPRQDKVQFDWQDPKSGPEIGEALNPFAALAKLKTKG
jgi:uncharacterized metal-binding protein YceD (DUF177 family)